MGIKIDDPCANLYCADSRKHANPIVSQLVKRGKRLVDPIKKSMGTTPDHHEQQSQHRVPRLWLHAKTPLDPENW